MKMKEDTPMGVKVRLADAREVNDKAHKAGDVVEVDPGDARLLVAIGAGVRVADAEATSGGEPVADAVPGNAGHGKDEPDAHDADGSDDPEEV